MKAMQVSMRHLILSLIFSTVLAASTLGLAGCETTKVKKNDDSFVTDTLYQAAFTAEQSNDYKSAIQYYQKLRMRVPDDLDIVLALARNLRYSGAENQAVKVLEELDSLEEQPSPVLLEYSKIKIALGKSREAIEWLYIAAANDSQNWEVYSILGIAHDLVDEFPQAKQAYEKALGLSQDNPAIYNNMAISAALSGDLDDAIAILNSVPRLTRNSAQLRQNLAFFYGVKGDIKSAEALARKDLDEESVQRNLEIYSQFRAY